MSKTILLCTGIALSILLAVATTQRVSAAEKKLSYEEAFKKCKQYLEQEKGGLSAAGTQDMIRSQRGAACMKKYGHKL